MVALYPASLSLQVQKPSTTGTKHQLFKASLPLSSLVDACPYHSSCPPVLSSPSIALLSNCVVCFVSQRSCFALPGKRACFRQVPVLLVPGESVFLLKMLLRARSSLSLLQSSRSLKCGRISKQSNGALGNLWFWMITCPGAALPGC